MMMNCIDAVSLGDAREIFVIGSFDLKIDLNFEIHSHLDNFCL
jgi:hypothetical protein